MAPRNNELYGVFIITKKRRYMFTVEENETQHLDSKARELSSRLRTASLNFPVA
jgi:hypothetical protein